MTDPHGPERPDAFYDVDRSPDIPGGDLGLRAVACESTPRPHLLVHHRRAPYQRRQRDAHRAGPAGTAVVHVQSLPAIALLPLALVWFGIGDISVIFVLIHAVAWSVALNAHAGFRGISPTLRMVGQNYGLSGFGYVARILLPGAFPSILTGLKVGWAFAWRTQIAAERVFGVSSGSGGLGWHINDHKNQLNIANVFAGLLTVIVFGLLVENLVFRTIESRTVRRWGMES